MVDSSDFETDVGTMDVYARGADPVYVTAPSSSQQEEGVKPLERLPAQWWNWFLHEATSRFSSYKSYISNALAELGNLLNLSGITPDDTKTNQLKGMFENDYLQKYLPEVVSDASPFAVDAAKESSILVSNDDGNDGFDVKKVPYSPCLIYNSQSIATVKTIALPANSPYDGQAFKVVFKNGHNCADSSTPMTLNGKPVLVNVNGTLSALPIHAMAEGGGTVYKSLQANTVLDIYYNANYDGNNNEAFVIIGNPVVLSSSDYIIYADGSMTDNRIYTYTPTYKVDLGAPTCVCIKRQNVVQIDLWNFKTTNITADVNQPTFIASGFPPLCQYSKVTGAFYSVTNGITQTTTGGFILYADGDLYAYRDALEDSGSATFGHAGTMVYIAR